MNTSEHPIFLKSIDYIKTQLGITGLDFVQQSVLERMIHSSGDFSFQGLLKFSPTACNQAMEALKKGVQIFTDTQMAKAAVSPMAKRTFNSNVQCILDMAPHSIDSSSTTRSAIGMRNIWLDLEKRGQFVNAPIVVIGSAPTALMALLDLIDKGSPIPSLIIGMPVGFIGVSESKNRLLNSKYPHIVLEGSKGGASLASAAINALLKAAHN